jgi:hypothetical protein
MPIPTTRAELTELVTATWDKLAADLERVDAEVAEAVCVDDWTVRDLLSVRVWWSESVLDWIEAGERGEHPVTPAPGYTWKETPRLNADIIERSRDIGVGALIDRLTAAAGRILPLIDSLDDHELLDRGHFEWAGNYPISRWISINTARQYTTARTYVRRALREAGR